MGGREPPARKVLLIDDQPLRRAAYVSLLGEWSKESDLDLRPEGFDTYEAEAPGAALLILSCGSMSIAELRLHVDLEHLDLRGSPLVVISDREEAPQVT